MAGRPERLKFGYRWRRECTRELQCRVGVVCLTSCEQFHYLRTQPC